MQKENSVHKQINEMRKPCTCPVALTPRNGSEHQGHGRPWDQTETQRSSHAGE